MRMIISLYLAPDEWRLGFSWGSGGFHQERIRAGTHAEAERVGKQMQDILESAIGRCRAISDIKIRREVQHDD